MFIVFRSNARPVLVTTNYTPVKNRHHLGVTLCDMESRSIFEWRAPEYRIVEKSTDWYWALGILTAAIAVAAILFGNVLLAVLVLCGAGAIAVVASKRPSEHRFALTEDGIVIDDNLWPYDSVMSFSMVEYLDETLPPFLKVTTRSILVPHLSIPLKDVDVDAVYAFMASHTDEEEHRPTVSDYVIELFRI